MFTCQVTRLVLDPQAHLEPLVHLDQLMWASTLCSIFRVSDAPVFIYFALSPHTVCGSADSVSRCAGDGVREYLAGPPGPPGPPGPGGEGQMDDVANRVITYMQSMMDYIIPLLLLFHSRCFSSSWEQVIRLLRVCVQETTWGDMLLVLQAHQDLLELQASEATY